MEEEGDCGGRPTSACVSLGNGTDLWIRPPYPRLVEGHQRFLVPPTLVGEVLDFVHFPVEKVHEGLQMFSGVCEPKV